MKPCEENLSALELTDAGKNMVFFPAQTLEKVIFLCKDGSAKSLSLWICFFCPQVPFENKIGRVGLMWFWCQPQTAAKLAFWSCCQSKAVCVTQLQFDFCKAETTLMSFQNFVVLPSFGGVWHTSKATLLLVLSLRSLCKLPFSRDFQCVSFEMHLNTEVL